MIVRLVAALCAVTLVPACSGRVQQTNFLPRTAVREPQDGGDLIVRISVRQRGIVPNYVSASTKGMTVHIAGLVDIKKTVGLTLGSAGCKSKLMTLACELEIRGLTACPSRKNCYVATVVTYDAFAKGKIPRAAHALSAAQDIGFHIARATTTAIPLILQGMPASVAFVPRAGSSLEGSQTSGFVLPKCSAGAQHVDVYGVDADGNYILGIGAPRSALTSSNASQLSVSAVSRASPNAFILSPPSLPAYPFGGLSIALTASASPGSHSGSRPARATIRVSYSGDICGHLDEFTVPTGSSSPTFIAVGPDRALWFSEFDASKIGRIPANATSGSSISEFATPTKNAGPLGIAAGPDGNVWFAEANADTIGRIPATARSGSAVTEIPASGTPAFIAAGPDGNMWFTEYGGNNVSRIPTTATPATPQITEFPIPTPNSVPEGIVVGPDHKLWFTEYNANKIATIATGGTPTVADYAEPGGSPLGIAAGPDGALWFTAQTSDAIGRIKTNGAVTLTLPLPMSTSGLQAIVAGPDGAMWFAEQLANKIGRVTAGGSLTEIPLPSVASQPTGIALGPDGAIWFTEKTGNKIGRLR